MAQALTGAVKAKRADALDILLAYPAGFAYRKACAM
jgi:hypothetical protein